MQRLIALLVPGITILMGIPIGGIVASLMTAMLSLNDLEGTRVQGRNQRDGSKASRGKNGDSPVSAGLNPYVGQKPPSRSPQGHITRQDGRQVRFWLPDMVVGNMLPDRPKQPDHASDRAAAMAFLKKRRDTYDVTRAVADSRGGGIGR